MAEATGFGLTDHVCWIYDQPQDFVSLAVEFLREGLDRRERIIYMGAHPVAELESHLEPLGNPTRLIEAGRLRVLSSKDMYEAGGRFDPDEQVEAYRLLGEAALADGYEGLRAAADLTSLVRTPAQLANFALYERLIDQLMARAPLTGMCGYQRGEIGAEAAGRLTALHPVSGGEHPAFRMFQVDRGSLALSGELDIASQRDFRWVLRQLEVTGPVTLDVNSLAFIDQASLLEIERRAREADLVFDLKHCSPTVRRMVDHLALERVRVAA